MIFKQLLKCGVTIYALLSITSCESVYRSPDATSYQEPATSDSADVSYFVISRELYRDQLEGFWLGQCIANWTGLITEMDKVGNIGEFKTGEFYTRDDWGKADQPSIWSEGKPSEISPVIDYFTTPEDGIWGADDDTDIEYMYQYLLFNSDSTGLTAAEIRDGWMAHIRPEEENFLWVSNQRAYDLMKEGTLPPATGDPENNEHCEMIDAQLTTEIFGLFAPTRPDVALELAHLPIRTTACKDAIHIAEFYVVLHSLASIPFEGSMKEQTQWMADQARLYLPDDSYAAAMFDFVLRQYNADIKWEDTRDSLYVRYQVEEADGYDMTSRNFYCNGCFAAGINFGASIISYFYGEGDIRKTIKIGALTGWDSDNPTATWGGLLGFMNGRTAVEKQFGYDLSSNYNIHRTRQGFPNEGIDSFPNMANMGLEIVERIVLHRMDGSYDPVSNNWTIPVQ